MGCLLRMMQIFKVKTYQQAVLRLGLPFIILYRGTHYLFYRLGSHGVEPYHWLFFITIDVVVMFVVSTMWWTFCRDREIASRKPKD
jgi:hypothetical protein